MNNTATKENNELSPYEIEQPIAALLGDFSRVILYPNSSAKYKVEKQAIEKMSTNAVEEMERWSRALAFLIWKASGGDDVCEQTVSSMATGAEVLGCFASMIQPLSDLKRIEYLGEKADSLEAAQSGNSHTDTSRDAVNKENCQIQGKIDVMLSEVAAIASTSMHRVMDGIDNENPVSTDTLIGLFSGIARQTEAIQSEACKIRLL